MLRFKTFILERRKVSRRGKSMLPPWHNTIYPAIDPYPYTIKSATSKTTTIEIKVLNADRKSTKEKIESKLTTLKIPFEKSISGGSIGSTIVNASGTNVKIIYKPLSGGMSETTLNSTITELFPALAFMANKKYSSARDIDAFYEFSKTASDNGVYVNAKDAAAGKEFINSAPSSSKFKEKMGNAIAILKYLNDQNAQAEIAQVYWGYRAKPDGIASNHKGDIFIKFKNGEMKGVSLKAGGERTAEPQLNTYVNKFFEDYKDTTTRDKVANEVYDKVHKNLGLDRDWESRSKKSSAIEKIEKLKTDDAVRYESLYNTQLEICRDAVIERAGRNMNDTINYIRSQILAKDERVPLEVVKAVNTNYKFVTDEDALDSFLPEVKSITSEKSSSSKQDWFINLSNKVKTIKMKMSVRSNKPQPQNKIAQGFNLAIKFNGIGS